MLFTVEPKPSVDFNTSFDVMNTLQMKPKRYQQKTVIVLSF